jgi:hypothetical protein
MAAIGFALLLAGCQTIVAPAGSDVVQRDGVLEITPRAEPAPEPVCLVRARFFRGLIGVKCSDLAQEIRP